MDKVYIIVMIVSEGTTIKPSFSVEPLGVYSDVELALDYINKLEKLTTDDNSMFKETVYDIMEFDMDGEPLMLSWLKKEKQMLEDTIQDAVLKLMQDGLVDQLIGEDGNFYYTLTDVGKAKMKNMPENIKKFFRKK